MINVNFLVLLFVSFTSFFVVASPLPAPANSVFGSWAWIYNDNHNPKRYFKFSEGLYEETAVCTFENGESIEVTAKAKAKYSKHVSSDDVYLFILEEASVTKTQGEKSCKLKIYKMNWFFGESSSPDQKTMSTYEYHYNTAIPLERMKP